MIRNTAEESTTFLIPNFRYTHTLTNDIYEGEWTNDRKHGKGTYKFGNGDVYTGDWNSDKMHGKGKFVTNDGKVCEGEFKNHRFV